MDISFANYSAIIQPLTYSIYFITTYVNKYERFSHICMRGLNSRGVFELISRTQLHHNSPNEAVISYEAIRFGNKNPDKQYNINNSRHLI